MISRCIIYSLVSKAENCSVHAYNYNNTMTCYKVVKINIGMTDCSAPRTLRAWSHVAVSEA